MAVPVLGRQGSPQQQQQQLLSFVATLDRTNGLLRHIPGMCLVNLCAHTHACIYVYIYTHTHIHLRLLYVKFMRNTYRHLWQEPNPGNDLTSQQRPTVRSPRLRRPSSIACQSQSGNRRTLAELLFERCSCFAHSSDCDLFTSSMPVQTTSADDSVVVQEVGRREGAEQVLGGGRQCIGCVADLQPPKLRIAW